MIAKMVTADVPNADAEAEAKSMAVSSPGNSQKIPQTQTSPLWKLEGDYFVQTVELRLQLLQQATQEAEQRLRADRNEWRQTAEHLQNIANKEE